jgi:hypothetical protein
MSERKAADIIADIAKWGKRGETWTKDGQKLGMEVLGHVEAHGDVTVANKLVAAMPKGTKRAAMIEWCVAFGKLDLHPKQDTKNGVFFAHSKDKTTDLVGAAKTPWTEFQPDPEIITVFDAQAAAIAAIDKLVKASKGKDIQTVHHTEVLDRLVALRNELAPQAAEEPAGNADPVPEAPF